jgi:hypothetical protein
MARERLLRLRRRRDCLRRPGEGDKVAISGRVNLLAVPLPADRSEQRAIRRQHRRIVRFEVPEEAGGVLDVAEQEGHGAQGRDVRPAPRRIGDVLPQRIGRRQGGRRGIIRGCGTRPRRSDSRQGGG